MYIIKLCGRDLVFKDFWTHTILDNPLANFTYFNVFFYRVWNFTST